jgi:hypothetical protein
MIISASGIDRLVLRTFWMLFLRLSGALVLARLTQGISDGSMGGIIWILAFLLTFPE